MVTSLVEARSAEAMVISLVEAMSAKLGAACGSSSSSADRARPMLSPEQGAFLAAQKMVPPADRKMFSNVATPLLELP